MKLLYPPLADEIGELCASAVKKLMVVSPWIKMDALKYVLGHPNSAEPAEVSVIMRGDIEDFLDETSDIIAVKKLIKAGATVRLISNLHAKTYIADDERAIIASSNLTTNGLEDSIEAGVLLEERDEVRSLVSQVEEWFDRGVNVDAAWLTEMRLEIKARREEQDQLLEDEQQLITNTADIRGYAIKLKKPRKPIVRSNRHSPAREVQMGEWSDKIKAWRKLAKHPEQAEKLVTFFQQAFAWLPEQTLERAWFGVHPRAISLVVGGITLARAHVVRGGELWLLVDKPNFLTGQYVAARSTEHYVPLGHYVCKWHQVSYLNEASEVWASYANAARKVLRSPAARRRIDAVAKNKQPLIALIEGVILWLCCFRLWLMS